MKSKYSYLFGNIKLFIIASFIPKALDLCMVSLYTRCLTDADYGIADLLANTVQLIMPVLTLQIQDAVLRDAMDERYQKRMFWASECGLPVVAVLFYYVYLLFCKRRHLCQST